jgi:hypothetical protein
MVMSDLVNEPTIEEEIIQLRNHILILNDDILYLHKYLTEFYLSVDRRIRELDELCREPRRVTDV